MAGTLVQFRLDNEMKDEADYICKQLGLDLPSYLKMCVSRLISENGIPFSMKNVYSSYDLMSILRTTSQIAAQNGTADMTLDEINEEIAEARKARLK
ncbi:MAG: type II toxin-antitoxin system RelB/DinJ family antitoxin [Clostridia bacterium]|nr:type II toxin-antitoxin system RelB/DinJ family antitoxin [Clostridia bacterium]